MAVPNYKAIVQKIYDIGTYDLTTKEGCSLFTRDVAAHLYGFDANFGELLKSAGRTHAIDPLGRRVAVDAILYRPTGQAVDVIGSSASPKAKPSWTVDQPRYTDKDWAIPARAGGGTGTTEPPAPPPPPPPPATDPEVDTLKEVVSAIIRAIEDLSKDLSNVRVAIAALDERLATEETKKLTLTATGSTGRMFGHAHPITITLKEE
jgi:hypothetical protein